jgi:hypothetical protein
LFEAQVVDLNAKPWIKPHFHVLIACENQDMFNQLMGRLETFLDPAERRILGDTASDIQKVISYFCKENYAGHQRGQNRGHSESIHETSNQAAIVELAMLVRLRRGRQTMRISGILGDAKVILHKKGLQSSTEKDREWLDMGSAPHGHLNVLLMMLDGEAKAKELINSMPTSVQDKSIAVESRKKKSSKLNRLKRKKSAAERRLKRSGYKDKNAELWVETIAEEIAKLELQPAVSTGEDCLSTKVEKESKPPKTVEPNVPSPLPLRVKCRKENKKRR